MGYEARASFCVLFRHPVPYSFEVGSLTDPRDTMTASKPQKSSCVLMVLVGVTGLDAMVPDLTLLRT